MEWPRRNVRLLTAISFCAGMRFSGPYLIVYFAGIAGSYSLGMSMFAATSLVQTILDVPAGILSDIAGRRPIIVAGMLLDLLATACYAASPGYGLLVGGAVLQGGAWALFNGNNEALIYETLATDGAVERYPSVLGKVLAAQHLAFGIAAVAAGVFALGSLRLVFWATLGPQSLALALCLALREPPREAPRTSRRGHLAAALRQFQASSVLRLLTAASALRYAVGESAYQFSQAFVATVWPRWALGIAPTLANLGSAVSFYVSGYTVRRFGALRVLTGDALLSRAFTAVALWLRTGVSPVLMSATSLSYGPAEVAMSALLQERFTDEQRATLASLASLASTLAYAVAAVLVGLLADRVGAVRTLLVAQVVLLLPLLLYRRAGRRA